MVTNNKSFTEKGQKYQGKLLDFLLNRVNTLITDIVGTADTGTTLSLNKVAGTNYNYAAPLNDIAYTLENPVENGQVNLLINAPSEPVFTPPGGYTMRKATTSELFSINTDMEVYFRVTGTVINYYFITY